MKDKVDDITKGGLRPKISYYITLAAKFDSPYFVFLGAILAL